MFGHYTCAHAPLPQREKTALEEENERTALELARERKPSAGRRGDVEAELAQQRRELTLLQRELQTLRDKKEKAETDVGEMRTELEREKERNIELEKKWVFIVCTCTPTRENKPFQFAFLQLCAVIYIVLCCTL